MTTVKPVKKEPVILVKKRKPSFTFSNMVPEGGFNIDDLETIRAKSWGKSVKSVRKKQK